MSGNRIVLPRLEDLPVNVLLEIFSYVNLTDLDHLRQTNRLFRNLLNLNSKTKNAGQINSLWKYKFQLHFPHHIQKCSAEADKTGWYIAFKKIYANEYKNFGENEKGLCLKRFFTAVKDGDLAYLQTNQPEIEELLKQDKDDKKLLYWAAINRHQHVLNYCYENIIVPAYSNQNPFKQFRNDQIGIEYWKVVCNQVKVKEDLLGMDVNAVCAYGSSTRLHIAAEYGHLETIQILIEAGANVNQKRAYDGYTPLYFAAENGHIEVVKKLIEANADVNQMFFNGMTSLYVAAKNGHVEVVKKLIEANAEVNKTNTIDGATPLYIAVQNDHVQVVRELIAANANVNQTLLYNGETPLYFAAENGHVEVVRELIAAKADVNQACTYTGITPLFIATAKSDLEIVKELIAAKADVNKASIAGTTPLYVASKDGQLEIMKELIAAKADANKACTYNGSTPLHISAKNNHVEVVASLVKAGAKVDVKNLNGKTAYDLTAGRCKQLLANLKCTQKRNRENLVQNNIAVNLMHLFYNYAHPPLFTFHWHHHRVIADEIATELFKNPTWSYEECKTYIYDKFSSIAINKHGTMASLLRTIECLDQDNKQEKQVENQKLGLKK